jgi:hypothetical protein
MDECHRQRGKRDSTTLMARARQSLVSLAQCVAPAFARLFARSAAAGMRPQPAAGG